MTFGEALRAELQRAGITPSELSKTTGMDIANVSRILHNHSKPTLPTLRRILKALPKSTDLRALLLYDE